MKHLSPRSGHIVDRAVPGYSVLLFLIGSLQMFDVTFLARTPIGEILAFMSLPFIMGSVRYQAFWFRSRLVVGITLLWCLSVALSDLVNESEITLFARGFARPIFCYVWFVFFYVILQVSPRSLFWYAAGLVVASIQNYFLPQDYTAYRLAVGGYAAVAWGVSIVLLALATFSGQWIYRFGKFYSVIAFFMIGVVLAAIGAPRNYVGTCLMTAVVLSGFIFVKQRRSRGFNFNGAKMVGFAIILGVSAALVVKVYAQFAEQGYLGDEQMNKIKAQSETVFGKSVIGLIIGGRTEVMAAILGVCDRPIIGHGSWTGRLMFDYYLEAITFVGGDPNVIRMVINLGGGSAGHSILFQTWLENGILSAIALLGVAYVFGRQFLVLVQRECSLAPLFVNLMMVFGWNYLFSPMAVSDRIVIGLFFALHVTRYVERAELNSAPNAPPSALLPHS